MEERRGRLMSSSAAADILCRKHPRHRQSPGVCSVCLKERLRQIPSWWWSRSSSMVQTYSSSSGTSSSSTSVSTNSLSPSSSCSSMDASPVHHDQYHYQAATTSGLYSSNSASLNYYSRGRGGNDHNLLMPKSRSMAAASTHHVLDTISHGEGEVRDHIIGMMKEKKKKKRSGFCSNLLIRRRRSKRIDVVEDDGLIVSKAYQNHPRNYTNHFALFSL